MTALSTYVLRAIPLLLLREKIESEWVNSFLYYVPWAVLTAMVIPAVFTATSSWISAAVGLLAAIILACTKRSLLTVSLGAAALVWVTELALVT